MVADNGHRILSFCVLRRVLHKEPHSVLASHVVFTSSTKHGNLGGALRDPYLGNRRSSSLGRAMYGMKIGACIICIYLHIYMTRWPHMENLINNTWERNTIVKRKVAIHKHNVQIFKLQYSTLSVVCRASPHNTISRYSTQCNCFVTQHSTLTPRMLRFR